MHSTNKLNPIRIIENKINKRLFWICSAVTVLIMMMETIEFFTRGIFSSADMNLFYLGILIIYSFHKELIRWLGKSKMERQGEYFVYAWIGLTIFLYIINFFSKNYFAYNVEGEQLSVVRDLSIISIEVLAVFIFTRGLKIFNVFLKSRGEGSQ